jgi:hemerythrin superfamily protein
MPSPLEHAATKGKASGALGARGKGLTGVFVNLAEQHKEASRLLRRAESLTDVEQRRDTWGRVRRELLAHEKAELEVIYPALADHPETSDIAERHADEAVELEETIHEIDAAGCAAVNWSTLLLGLIAQLEDHIEDEEHEFFPMALEAMGDEQANRLQQPFFSSWQRELDHL